MSKQAHTIWPTLLTDRVKYDEVSNTSDPVQAAINTTLAHCGQHETGVLSSDLVALGQPCLFPSATMLLSV